MKLYYYCTIILLGLFVMRYGKADTITFDKGFYTKHVVNGTGRRNEDNNLLAVIYRFTDSNWTITAASFINSYRKPVKAISSSYIFFQREYFTMELLGGLMKGYEQRKLGDKLCPLDNAQDICWFIAPKASLYLYKEQDFNIKTSAIFLGEALALSIGIEFNF